MSTNTEPVLPTEDNLEFLVAEFKPRIIDAFCNRLGAGKPLRDETLETRYEGFNEYFGFLTHLLTDQPPTEITKGITSRSFHFGYYLSQQVVHSGMVMRDFYTGPTPAAMADRIIEASNAYLDVRPHLDSVVQTFLPELVERAADYGGLARVSAGLALLHVEQFQRDASRQRRIEAEVAAFAAELESL